MFLWNLHSGTFPSPCYGVQLIGIPYADWLYRHTRVKCSCLERDKTGPVGAGPFRKNEYLRPIQFRIGSFNNFFDRVLPGVWVLPPDIYGLRVINQLYKVIIIHLIGYSIRGEVNY